MVDKSRERSGGWGLRNGWADGQSPPSPLFGRRADVVDEELEGVHGVGPLAVPRDVEQGDRGVGTDPYPKDWGERWYRKEIPMPAIPGRPPCTPGAPRGGTQAPWGATGG